MASGSRPVALVAVLPDHAHQAGDLRAILAFVSGAVIEFFETRTAVVLSLLLPLLIGIILVLLVNFGVIPYALFISYFGTINFRMIAIPSIALDIYTDFFSTHHLTHFCQIQFLKPLVDCPYNDYLSVIMERNYHLGNLNASLFATEGIASVGPLMAPLVAFICGLIIAAANRLSAGLPAKFVLCRAVYSRRSF